MAGVGILVAVFELREEPVEAEGPSSVVAMAGVVEEVSNVHSELLIGIED